jgi:hypothetical protein
MGTKEFPAPGPGAGINSHMEFNRATPVVLRNSRFLCWVTMSGSFVAAFMAVCMVLMVISLVFPLSALTVARGGGIFNWTAGGLAMSYMCIRLWSLARAMAGYQVYLDGRGVKFSLGTKKKPAELFMAWDQISAIKRKRAGNVQQYWVEGTDGSEARFSSYTFFRPKKVACMIAERAGLVIEKA